MSRYARRTVVRHRFVRAGRGVKAKLWDALHYMQYRPLGQDEQPSDRCLFTARTEGLSRLEARALLMEHAGRRVAYHRLILSPGIPVEDVQRWTRQVMADLARHLGQELHWVAVAHHNTQHPHAHVLLAGTGARLGDGGGHPLPVRLHPEEYAVLRQAGDRHAREQARDERDLEEAVRTELDSMLAGLARVLGHEPDDDGVQTHTHLTEQHERRGAPGRDATRGR
jgi:hypothetical protein